MKHLECGRTHEEFNEERAELYDECESLAMKAAERFLQFLKNDKEAMTSLLDGTRASEILGVDLEWFGEVMMEGFDMYFIEHEDDVAKHLAALETRSNASGNTPTNTQT